MLLNKLFTYKLHEGDSISSLKFSIIINENHEIFKGHFPGNPITPGVCQMEMVKEVLNDFLGKDLFYRSVSDMKFINMWIPNDSELVYLDLTINEFEDGYKIKACIYTDILTYFKLIGIVNGSF
jgi:3-hydroxyacyl-[acyl-carrier-protein] dehydratase